MSEQARHNLRAAADSVVDDKVHTTSPPSDVERTSVRTTHQNEQSPLRGGAQRNT